MWKRPARLAALSLLAARAASAGDLGETVSFPRVRSLEFVVSSSARQGDVLFDTGEGLFIPTPWDTVIFQGMSPDSGVRFEAARKDAAGVWTPWVAAQVKRHPGGRFWGKASFPRAPGAARLRAVADAPPGAHAVSLYGVEVFTAGTGAASGRAFEPSGETPPGRPAVTERSGWGAKPPKNPWEPDVPQRLTVHHTSGPQPDTMAASIKEIFFIQDFHQNGRGWNDIAYHFLIDGAGNVFEGRPLGTLGAHALHANANNVGVALLGTHQAPENHVFGAGKRAAFVKLARWLDRAYSVSPATLKGHRDYKATDCPGDLVYAELAALKQEIAAPDPAAAVSKPPMLPVWLRLRPSWD